MIVAATVVRGPTALQLQAYRSDGSRTWDTVREELRQTMRSRGAVVEEWAGDAGPELRALLPVTTAAGNADTQRVRMLGCEGPGWLLRGIVSGAGAASESRSVWVYDTFLQAVVVPAARNGGVTCTQCVFLRAQRHSAWQGPGICRVGTHGAEESLDVPGSSG